MKKQTNIANVWGQAANEFGDLIEDLTSAEKELKDLEGEEIKRFVRDVTEEIKSRLRKIVELIITGLPPPEVV